jgi:NADPH-dependent F420 reductase
MKVAVLGGTGDFGGGLALRLADAGHEVVVGSRNEDDAKEAAVEYAEESSGDVSGTTNRMTTEGTDAAVLGVPPEYAAETAEDVLDGFDGVVITPVVGISREDGDFVYTPPEEGSYAAQVREVVDAPLAGAFHNLAAEKMAALHVGLDGDVAVFGEEEAKETASELAESIGVRPLDVGGFGVAPQVEAMTPLLINVGTKNGIRDAGVRFV